MERPNSFTLEKLRAAKRLVDAMPRAPVFATWNKFPTDHVISFKYEGRDYVGAHPDFWKQIPVSDRERYQSLEAIKIIDLALTCYAKERAAFLGAMLHAALVKVAKVNSPTIIVRQTS